MPPAGLVVLLVTIALPLIELALLIKATQLLGIWVVLAIVLTTAFAGVWIIQEQGLSGMRRLSETVRQGKPLIESMMYGNLLYLAAFCLIAPGLITDTLGLVLLVPPVRSFAAKTVHDWMTGLAPAETGPVRPDIRRPENGEPPRRQPRGHHTEPPIIEGEFERLDERPIDPHGKDEPRKP